MFWGRPNPDMKVVGLASYSDPLREMGEREEPRVTKVVELVFGFETGAAVELEKEVEKAPPKKMDLPSAEGAMASTAPFNPEKGRGDQLEVAVDHAATFPP